MRCDTRTNNFARLPCTVTEGCSGVWELGLSIVRLQTQNTKKSPRNHELHVLTSSIVVTLASWLPNGCTD